MGVVGNLPTFLLLLAASHHVKGAEECAMTEDVRAVGTILEGVTYTTDEECFELCRQDYRCCGVTRSPLHKGSSKLPGCYFIGADLGLNTGYDASGWAAAARSCFDDNWCWEEQIAYTSGVIGSRAFRSLQDCIDWCDVTTTCGASTVIHYKDSNTLMCHIIRNGARFKYTSKLAKKSCWKKRQVEISWVEMSSTMLNYEGKYLFDGDYNTAASTLRNTHSLIIVYFHEAVENIRIRVTCKNCNDVRYDRLVLKGYYTRCGGPHSSNGDRTITYYVCKDSTRMIYIERAEYSNTPIKIEEIEVYYNDHNIPDLSDPTEITPTMKPSNPTTMPIIVTLTVVTMALLVIIGAVLKYYVRKCKHREENRISPNAQGRSDVTNVTNMAETDVDAPHHSEEGYMRPPADMSTLAPPSYVESSTQPSEDVLPSYQDVVSNKDIYITLNK